MKLEYRYYTKAKERMQRIEKEIEVENQQLSEEERIIQSKKAKEDAEKIMERGERLKQATRYLENPKKIDDFSALYQKMILFAKYMECDIIIESDLEKYGKIILCFENMLFDEHSSKEMMPIYLEYLTNASMVWFSSEDNVIQIDCTYQLADRLYMQALLS